MDNHPNTTHSALQGHSVLPPSSIMERTHAGSSHRKSRGAASIFNFAGGDGSGDAVVVGLSKTRNDGGLRYSASAPAFAAVAAALLVIMTVQVVVAAADDDAVYVRRAAERASTFKACLTAQQIEAPWRGHKSRVHAPVKAVICPTKAVAFIHIYKSGGTSIEKSIKDICPGSVVVQNGYNLMPKNTGNRASLSDRHVAEQDLRHGITPHVAAIEAEPAGPVRHTVDHNDTAAKAAHDLWEDAIRRAFIADLSHGSLFTLFSVVREDLPARFLSGLYETGVRREQVARVVNATDKKSLSVDDVAATLTEAKRNDGMRVAETAITMMVAGTGCNATTAGRQPFNAAINHHLKPQWTFLGRLARGSRFHAYPGLRHVVAMGSMSNEIPALLRHLFKDPLPGWELPHARARIHAHEDSIAPSPGPGLLRTQKRARAATAIIREIAQMSVSNLSQKTTRVIQQFYSVDEACIAHSRLSGT